MKLRIKLYALRSVSMLSPETILQNRYHIRHSLGSGGQAAIYRAWDQRLQIDVAIKELAPQTGFDLDNWQQLRNQFRQEAIILARLQHPNLVKVSDHFDSGSNSYLVMALIEGETLDGRIERTGAISPALATDWLRQLLSALDHCHTQGVIHRDIKPANIIIQPDNKPILVDFGLVKQLNPHNPATQTIVSGMGSLHYAPPEQYGSQAGHTDGRSDIYGLGATFYHALTATRSPPSSRRPSASAPTNASRRPTPWPLSSATAPPSHPPVVAFPHGHGLSLQSCCSVGSAVLLGPS
ncbi:MAG: serine/threonine-protein kinase [Chloroflexota bacterium]